MSPVAAPGSDFGRPLGATTRTTGSTTTSLPPTTTTAAPTTSSPTTVAERRDASPPTTTDPPPAGGATGGRQGQPAHPVPPMPPPPTNVPPPLVLPSIEQSCSANGDGTFTARLRFHDAGREEHAQVTFTPPRGDTTGDRGSRISFSADDAGRCTLFSFALSDYWR